MKRNRISDETLHALATRVGQGLELSQRTITTAESCTGGFVAKCLTDIAGSSAWFNLAVVTYSNVSKIECLGVSARALRIHGAVSEEVARAMCRGALLRAGADMAVAITGVAGPGGGSPSKPVGTVWFGWAMQRGRSVADVTIRRRFMGDRDEVRRKSVREALTGVLRLIQ